MEKKDYVAPVAEITELSTDIVLMSDEWGWGDFIPVGSYDPGKESNSSNYRW